MNAIHAVEDGTSREPAFLERLGTVAVEMGRAGLQRALVWAALGAMAGLLADVVSYLVARQVDHGSMPLGPSLWTLVTLGIPFATAGAFALYGAQVGAIEAGFRHEPDVGVLELLVVRGLETSIARLQRTSDGPTRAGIEAAVREASRHWLGQSRARWAGPFGIVARIVHGTLARLYERSLAAALVDAGPSGLVHPLPEGMAERAHAKLVEAMREVFSTVLALELTAIALGVGVAALVWYPLCGLIVRLVPW